MLASLNHIDLRFGPQEVLKDVTWAIQEGECWGVIGRNGAGTSTVFKLLLGHLEADGGTVVRPSKERGIRMGHYAQDLVPATGGSIINISSVAAISTPATSSIYSATKGAVNSITGVLAKELGARKIRVNSINPGPVHTEGYADSGIVDSDFEKAAIAQTPLGRVGHPEDIGPIAVFLASDDSGWLTGESLYATGGLR